MEYGLYFVGSAQPGPRRLSFNSLQEKGMHRAGLPKEPGGFMNNPGWAHRIQHICVIGV